MRAECWMLRCQTCMVPWDWNIWRRQLNDGWRGSHKLTRNFARWQPSLKRVRGSHLWQALENERLQRRPLRRMRPVDAGPQRVVLQMRYVRGDVGGAGSGAF